MKYIVSYLHDSNDPLDDWYDKSPSETFEQAKELAESLKNEHEIVIIREERPILVRYVDGELLK